MKGVEKFEVEIADKADNKKAVIDTLMQRYYICEEVAEALLYDALATARGLQFLFFDIENNKLERMN